MVALANSNGTFDENELSEDVYDKEISQLCISDVGFIVQKLLKLENYPEASMENIQFEAGFHLFLDDLYEELLATIDILRD